MTTDLNFSLFTDFDIQLFKAGKHYHLYNKLGSHVAEHQGQKGVYFAVWAPNARFVSVVGNFNLWDRQSHPLKVRWDGSGIWEAFLPGVQEAEYYKYFIESNNGYSVEKGDPYAFHWENPPHTATITWDIDYAWNDQKWLASRAGKNPLSKPISVYEVHIGSWRRVHEEEGRFMTYKELANELPAYCSYMGFTHVEFMPVMEHPFYGSWGYQLTGYFAPSSRYGTPQEFMFLIDKLHESGIGVILDWVPSHFPTDEHGLGYFDGTHLYEYDDPRKGFHPDWKSNIFNLTRNEVRAFLISNALYWLDKYHIDALRVDAVASMLYLDYSRKEGEWIPNQYGGRENLEAISFLQEFNQAVHTYYPDVFTVAEESTAWPGVTSSVESGGLGFDMKWMMGWMHDTLDYFAKEPIYRKYHQGQLTFSLVYAYSEKFTLPLSHDEVVYGKASLLDKMPGDRWQKFANLRLLFSYMYGHPGAKLIFMGGEFAQQHEWQHDYSLDWHENNDPLNNGVQKLLRDLNSLYKEEPGLYERNFDPGGFEWIDISDASNSVISWIRKGNNRKDDLIFIASLVPVVYENYRIGVPEIGFYKEIFNSDNLKYGGSDVLNDPEIEAFPIPMHGRTHSVPLILPPLGLIVLKYVRSNPII
ncbi:1,4-alpha-glucan branching enzyme [Arcticibacter tournemirensis]|uniref:1,4-alpha-glucan branching enzyme GlgB n=1 Tax=Arcticibacter tournemirensis TaxID=699437 RepID=A0A4Q0M575_9SPHI|nr:1,4-alpha-glucan branching protein GlgB [Arcticibacter tournemirensis]KAA8485283.1 1,4-alpha-glucan branching protein GlgB [Arcticibacter tournemirensis]RXF68140.1 1,4-alpha-glucan branching protein GlgB [Arcticibacter tournemirensis]TQM50433.1 1,4-alpha-glucan branching enzyme [Arcticibacter tournemirensis]